MKLIIAAALAASALSAASAPAMAQSYGPPPQGDWHDHDRDYGGPGFQGPGNPGGWDVMHRIDWMQDRINRGRADGSLGRYGVWRAERQLNNIRLDVRRSRDRDGGELNGYDRQRIEDRLNNLNDQLHALRENNVQRPW